jgi:hypothetical protein
MWLRAWRSEPQVFVSPLTVEVARARLIEGRTSYLRLAFTLGGGGGGYRVIGHVGARRVSLQAAKVGVRNSWRPVMRGRLEAAGTGCQLTGKLGWSPFVKGFCVLWLTGVCLAFLFTMLNAVVQVSSGDATVSVFLFCCLPVGFLLFFVALTSWGIHVGRGEERYLRQWLVNRLQTEGSGVPGYRPWQGGVPH